MKMIDVLNMMAEGKIKNDTKLIASTVLDTYEYKYSTGYRRFFNKYFNEIEDDFSLDEDFLNIEVELIPPKPKKYYLRLHGGTSNFKDYVNRHNENFGLHSYIIDDDEECNGYYTKFTQEEIDNDKLLKFVEKYGVKEEVEDNESMDS